jgi:UDPglucose 6-dehydrogenase
MRVCVIGTGYVGLVTGVCLAHVGHEVICVDNDLAKVELMQTGKSPIYEPGLSDIMHSAMSNGKLSFTTDLDLGVKHGEVLFIAVGTPSLPNGSSDTRYVEAVAKEIGKYLVDRYTVIVNKSTVPIGSGDWVKMLVMDGVITRQSKEYGLAEAEKSEQLSHSNVKFDVISNPEFLREGSAVYDTFNPDRIVLGSSSQDAIDLMQALYAPIVNRKYAEDKNQPPVPVLTTDLGSAEMIKYAANAFLATKISFINEVANICERVGADVTQVAKGIGLDSRIGSKFLNAGIGWGGSCFPKDVSALINTGEDYGYNAQLLKAVVSVNQQQRLLVIEKLQTSLKILKGKIIGLLGLTFKPDTDDLRDAPSLEIINRLQDLGAIVKAYDPMIKKIENDTRLVGIKLMSSPEELAIDCHAIVLLTEWKEFKTLDYSHLAGLVTNRLVIDTRNFLSKETLVKSGFDLISIGK